MDDLDQPVPPHRLEGAWRHDSNPLLARLIKQPAVYPACTAEGGTGQGDPRHQLGTRLPVTPEPCRRSVSLLQGPDSKRSNRIQGCGARFARTGRLPSVRCTDASFGSAITVMVRLSVGHGKTMTQQHIERNLIESGALPAAVKSASRGLRRWPAASLDRLSGGGVIHVKP